jgi:hypothetical protein
MSALLAGLPLARARLDRQPPVRIGPGRRGHRRPCHQGRRSRPDDRRRRREHEPRTLRDAQGGERLSRANAVYDTTIGWRFVNKLMKELYGVDSMPETAENVATDFKIEREAQDRMALASPDEGGGGAEGRLLRRRDRARSRSHRRRATRWS